MSKLVRSWDKPGVFNARDFAALIRLQGIDTVRLSLEQAQTERGVLRILRAELAGLRRPTLIWTAERRLTQLRGQELSGVRTLLAAEGLALEPGEPS